MTSAGSEKASGAAVTRRAAIFGLASVAATATLPAAASAPALLHGGGDIRSLYLTNARTGEWVRTVYWVEGAYVPEALQAIDYLMRDWREDLVHRISPQTIDILSATHQLLGCSEPFHLVSGYRSPQTNELLRRRGRGVARKSYHIKGMAADIQLKTRSVAQICRAGRSLVAGGVGRYSHSAFVHLDSGPVRNWGR